MEGLASAGCSQWEWAAEQLETDSSVEMQTNSSAQMLLPACFVSAFPASAVVSLFAASVNGSSLRTHSPWLVPAQSLHLGQSLAPEVWQQVQDSDPVCFEMAVWQTACVSASDVVASAVGTAAGATGYC